MMEFRSASDLNVPHACVPAEGPARPAADIQIIGGVCTLLVPVLDVLDGCGWTVRYQAWEDAAVEWLKKNRTYVAVVEVDETWRDVVARLQQGGNCGKIILATRWNLPIEDVLSAGAHGIVRVPLEAYDLLWTLVTARREAQSELGDSWRFP